VVHVEAGHASVPLAEVANPSQENEHHVSIDRGDITVALPADLVGPVEVIAIGPPDGPLPVAGHCSRSGTPTTVYGPHGSPLRDRCRGDAASRPAKGSEPA
jgi:hypothetical protein